ncbi:MAG: peptidase U32 family protein [Candidatus Nanoarchaeia archaeon]|jgi:putative protease
MKPELLAPCHDFATLSAAVEAGADAVYFGVKKYNMRLKANNFNEKDLLRITKLCHKNNVKAYLTVNVVVYEDELKSLKKLLIKAKRACVDAVIVHDLATLRLSYDLGLECHVSTQANITNSESIKSYASMGASRVILSRELTLKQLRTVIKQSPLPVEVFVHGAMCVSISGRCFFSQAMYHKSANRGECNQPCRQEWVVKNNDGEFIYDGESFLNSKDLCMIEHLPELIKAGPVSLKIEGRMKDANYVSTVTKCYREAIDDFSKKRVIDWKNRLSSVFNRGFCTGFYYNKLEENIKSSGNASPIKKEFIGVVTNYYAKQGVAEIELKSGKLTLGEKIIIESAESFHKQVVDSMEVNHNKIKVLKKGSKAGIKVSKRVSNGAQVYKIMLA